MATEDSEIAFQQADEAVALSPMWLQNDSPPVNGGPMGIGGRFMWNLGLASDALLEKLNQGVLARMPTRCDPSALPLIGNDRVMTQGPGETTAAFRLRLQRAFEIWQHAGEARSVLELVEGYTAGLLGAPAAPANVPICAVVGGSGAKKWDWLMSTSDPTSAPNHYQLPTSNWSWDGQESVMWWRSWLVLYCYLEAPVLTGSAATVASNIGNFFTITGLAGIAPTVTSLTQPGYLTLFGAASGGNNGTFQITEYLSPTSVVVANPNGVALDAHDGAISWELAYFSGIQPSPVWGFPGATWGSNTNVTWGLMFPGAANTINGAGYWAQLRALLSTWKSAQTFYPWVIVCFSSPWNKFDPWNSPNSGQPDGTWATWAKRSSGADVQARAFGLQGSFDNYNAFVDGAWSYLPQSNVQVT